MPASDERRSLDSVPIPPEVRAILEADGITSLYPPQADALGPALAGESVVLACPTASGKSLVAYLALLRAARAGHTGLYLVPLRALAAEKYEELREFETLGVKVGISIGDYDISNADLEKIDILVATSEKADGLLRKRSPWLDRLGAVVADEVHLMRDADRGPTLEVSLTRLRRLRPNLQVVALSATVGNSNDIADWLHAKHVASEFRPVPLKSGVYHDGRILFADLTEREVPGPGEALPRLVRDVIRGGGQALVFVNTRKASDQTAQSLAATVRATLRPEEKVAAREAAEELAAVSEEETDGFRRLSGLLPDGVAYHNASLTNAERRVVERAFKDRVLKALVATPTLAAGINLPARRVIVRDTTRYDDQLGMQARIPAMEIQQMCGRAGRPRFDQTGEAILLARTEDEAERYLDEYLSAPPEHVQSRLAAEPALRMHLLALVSSGQVSTETELNAFFAETFFGHTVELSELNIVVENVRQFLEKHEFLEPVAELRATPFGALTSELYLDPMSAVVLRQALEKAPINPSAFSLLAAVAATPDLPPMFLRRGEEADLLNRFTDSEPELLVKPEEEPLRLDLESFLSTLKTASVLEAWVDETPLVDITERFGIGAGDVRAKVEDGDWLLFGTSRLAVRYQRRATRAIDELSLRVRYGVREELLDLVRIRGIGRMRGRALFKAGFADREALKGATVDRLESILRSRPLARSVLEAVGAKRRTEMPEPTVTPRPATPATPPTTRKRAPRRLDEFGPS